MLKQFRSGAMGRWWCHLFKSLTPLWKSREVISLLSLSPTAKTTKRRGWLLKYYIPILAMLLKLLASTNNPTKEKNQNAKPSIYKHQAQHCIQYLARPNYAIRPHPKIPIPIPNVPAPANNAATQILHIPRKEKKIQGYNAKYTTLMHQSHPQRCH